MTSKVTKLSKKIAEFIRRERPEWESQDAQERKKCRQQSFAERARADKESERTHLARVTRDDILAERPRNGYVPAPIREQAGGGGPTGHRRVEIPMGTHVIQTESVENKIIFL